MRGVAPVEGLRDQAEADLRGPEHGDQGGALQHGDRGHGEPHRGEGQQPRAQQRQAWGRGQGVGSGEQGSGE